MFISDGEGGKTFKILGGKLARVSLRLASLRLKVFHLKDCLVD